MRKTLLSLAALACVVPTLAFAAADPRPNSHFSYCTSPDRCVLDFDVNKAGTKIKYLSMYPKCAPVPIDSSTGTYPAIRIENGKFSKSGTVTDVTGAKIDYKVQGKFTRPRKAVGTYDVDSKKCSDSPQDFVAKRDGKAQGSPY